MTTECRHVDDIGPLGKVAIMHRVAASIRWGAELTIAAALIWMLLRPYHQYLPTLLFVFPLFFPVHWFTLKQDYRRLDPATRRFLTFATGPSAFLSLALALANNADLQAGAGTKEMGALAARERVPSECAPLWRQGHEDRWKSERLMAGVLCVALCLLYANRLSAGMRASKKIPPDELDVLA